VCHALTLIGQAKGIRRRHVLDDPVRYGLPMDIVKTEGGMFTSWMLFGGRGVELSKMVLLHLVVIDIVD
jgi:hypothetical protein